MSVSVAGSMPAVRFASAASESGKRTEYTEPATPIAPARNMQMPAAFERDRGPRESRGATGGPGSSKSSGRGTHAAGEGDGGGIDASGRTHSIGGGSDRPFSRSALSIPGTERGCDRAYLTVLRGCTLDEERRSWARERTRTFMDAAGHRFRKRRALTMGMRPLQWIIAALVLVLLLGTVAAAASAAGERAKVIVGYRGSLESAARVIQGYGGSLSIAYRNIPALAADVPARAVGAIASSAGIEYVERVQTRQVTTHIVPGEVWAGTPEIVPWGVDKVGAPSAWGTTRGDGVRVAVLDTGIDATHPDLAGNLDAAASYDFIDMDEDPSDIPGPYQGHGTLTSGNIAAIDNDVGVVGVAPESTIVFFRVCEALEGNCFTDAIVAGIDAAIDAGADVISMSFGGSAASIGERRIIRAAWNAGIVLVASSGNAGRPPVNFPAALREVIAVGATDVADRLADFSSFGHDQELVGPGVDVPTTYLNGLAADATLEQTAPTTAALEPIPMSFTAVTDADGITALLAFAGRATDAEVASMDLTGKIALIERGDITFKEKVENVASKGALAAVIYNNVAGNFGGTLQSPSTIPAVSISRAEGLGLEAQLDAGTAVELELVVAASGYDTASGTSFSAPHVAGVAALVIAANPSLTGFQVRLTLDLTATDLGRAG